MKREMRTAVIAASLLLLFYISPSLGGEIERELDEVLQTSEPDQEIEVLITFTGKADLKPFKELERSVRTEEIVKELKRKEETLEKPVREHLVAKKAKEMKSLWIANTMAARVKVKEVKELALQPGVESVKLDATVQATPVTYGTVAPSEWNLVAIRAPELWNMGITGRGIVMANMDTGVDLNHPDLSRNWRGGSNSWYDPNGEHLFPYDANGHGTQVMGIMAGGGTSGTAIGVAPDALWIAVKIFNDSGVTTLSKIHLGFQWLLDPDHNPATNDVPDIVNNSWGLGNINGCSLEFQADIQALKESGIQVVFSSGNSGPNPMTSESPANNQGSISVGAVDDGLNIAAFSGRGPSACGNIYPEFAAPGVNVKTADLTYGGVFRNSYAFVSGTSYASAHISGGIALLLSGFPRFSVEAALKQSAVDKGLTGVDNDYGYGVIDLAAASNLLQNPGLLDEDRDGYPKASDCNDADPSIHSGAPEVKHDGIDQDCNGYDLTIDVLKAVYNPRNRSLRVEATSKLAKAAELKLTGFGDMKWYRKDSRWITFRRVKMDPGEVSVEGKEGAVSSVVTRF